MAGISRLQTRELQARSIDTLAELAAVPVPIPWKPVRGAKQGYTRVREQARIQRDGRTERRAIHELLPFAPGHGFALLPEPSAGDLFVDLEADPYVGEGGIEFLFGWAARASSEDAGWVYHRRWALDAAGEKKAFEALIDVAMERWAADPGMHLYHFGAYEPGAMKRLMGRYATREAEVDRLLRGGRFVDLHTIVRQSLRASVEEYSIKKLEALYGFTRQQGLPEAGASLRAIQHALELGEAVDPGDANGAIVEAYNRDDCLSARALRDWLESLRAKASGGRKRDRAPAGRAGGSERADRRPGAPIARAGRATARRRARAGAPSVPRRSRARWLLAHLLDWHRREEKAPWWEYFRLREMSEEELLDETAAIAGLEFVERLPFEGKAPIDRYRFPAQETGIRAGDKLHLPLPEGREFGEVVEIDLAGRTVDIKKRMAYAALHPTAVFEHDAVSNVVQSKSLMRLGEWVASNGMDAPGPHRAARDLLLGRGPRLAGYGGGPLEPARRGWRACRPAARSRPSIRDRSRFRGRPDRERPIRARA